MIDEVPWGTVHCLELHGQGPQAAITGQPEGGVFFEHFAVQVHANVSSHVLGADLQDLARQGRDSVRSIPQPPSLSTPGTGQHPRGQTALLCFSALGKPASVWILEHSIEYSGCRSESQD